MKELYWGLFFLSKSSSESSHVCTPQEGEALSVKPLCRSTPRLTFKICMCHPLAPQAMNQCRLCKKKKKSSCIESSSHLGHSFQSWRGETLRLKGNIFPLKWNNCDMGFAFFFSLLQVLKKNNVLPAVMNLFWGLKGNPCPERRRVLSQEGEGRPFSTCVPVYPGAALGCEGGNTQGEKIQGDQIIFPFVSEWKKERK